MSQRRAKIKYFSISIWLLFLFVSLYVYFFNNSLLSSKFLGIFGSSLLFGYIVYLVAACLRGFTLIPVTYFIVVGIILLPPWPLYIMTIIGVLVSSTCVYYFSEYLN